MESKDSKIKVTRASVGTQKPKVQRSSQNAGKLKVQTSANDAPQFKVSKIAMDMDAENHEVSTDFVDMDMDTVNIQVPTESMDMDNENLKVTTSLVEAGIVQVNAEPIHNDNQKVSVPVDDDIYDPVKIITKKKEIWRLGVIVDDMWTVYKGETENHIELLLRDIKGNTIQATIMENDIELWKPKICKGKTYYMRNFKVHDNDYQFKMTPHKCRLTFVGATRVDERIVPDIPITLFNFKDFAQIQSGDYRPDLLVDAIGVVDTIKKIVNAAHGKKGTKVEFTLKDLRDNIIDCTLWDALSIEFLNNYNQLTVAGPVVLIIKHARVKEAQGVYPLQLTNAWTGTQMLFDTTIPEIQEFKNSLPKDAIYATQKPYASNSTQFYSQSSAGSQYNSDENFIKQARVIQLGDMKKLNKDTFCVTVATTSHIRVSNQGWFFRSCPDCNCKADGDAPPYICRNNHQSTDPQIKYKLDVEVYDGDDTAKFVFWDSTLDDLLGITAANLLEKQTKLGLGDPQEYPRCVDDIMERKFAFRVKWQTGWGGHATVLNCKDSDELIAKIQECLPVAESSCKDIEPIAEQGDAIASSPPIQSFTQSDIDKFGCLDDSILSTPNVSTSAENDMSVSSNKTPAKRTAGKQIAIEHTNLASEFSSNRSGKVIKKEKL